jgi:dTDP-4-amino-4,6-dideoxygalactose transaminase
MADLAGQHRALGEELAARVQACLDSGQYIGGPEVSAFEQACARYLGVSHAIGVNSGTDALILALLAAGVGPGDEVVTSPLSFVASVGAICRAGARPVFADIDPVSHTLSAEAVERVLTPRTRALLPVHLFGQPADMAGLMAIAARHGLEVIEDCAQSWGASCDGRQTGAFGTAGAFSFYPTKNLGAVGDGGLVVTQRDDIAARIRSLANHGLAEPGTYREPGFNSRLDTLQAVVLQLKLNRVDGWNARRRQIAARYDARLRDLPLALPARLPGRRHVYHHYTVLAEDREALSARLRGGGIETAVYYPVPLHRQPAFAHLGGGPLPVAEAACRRCLSLPVHAGLSDDEVDEVAAAVAAAVSSGSGRA